MGGSKLSLRKLIGKLRQAWNLSKSKSRYMPPSMRGKLRFANVFPCVNWARKMLAQWEKLEEEVHEQLRFLKDHCAFIQSLCEVELIFKLVCDKLKNEGFGKTQKQEILDALSPLKVSPKASVFMNNCKEYLEQLSAQQTLLGYEKLLCTSDIILTISYYRKLFG